MPNSVLNQFCISGFSPATKFAKLFYVGSTEKSAMALEHTHTHTHTRFRKYKQVLEDKLVSAELSLRYWAQ